MWNTSFTWSYTHSRLAKYLKKKRGGPGGEEGVAEVIFLYIPKNPWTLQWKVLNLYSRGILNIAIFEGNSLKLDSDSTNLLRFAGNSFSKRRHGKKPMMEHGELLEFPLPLAYFWSCQRPSGSVEFGKMLRARIPRKARKPKRRAFGMRLSQIRALQKVASQRSITAACTVGQNWTSRSFWSPAGSFSRNAFHCFRDKAWNQSIVNLKGAEIQRRCSSMGTHIHTEATEVPTHCPNFSAHGLAQTQHLATRRQGSRVPRL